MNKQVPVKFLIGLIWVAAVTWLLVMLMSCGLSRTQQPAKQQKNPTPQVSVTAIPVSQADQNQDGMLDITEQQQLHTTNTDTAIWIFSCVGALTLLSCVACAWVARHTKRPASAPCCTPSDDSHGSEPTTDTTQLTAASGEKTERLRRSKHK